MREPSSRRLDLTTPINNPGLTLRVETYVSTGTDPLTRPGVRFEMIVDHVPEIMQGANDQHHILFGVVDRNQIKQLYNLLDTFLRDYPV